MAFFSEVCAALKLAVPEVNIYERDVTERGSSVAVYALPEFKPQMREVLDGYGLAPTYIDHVGPVSNKVVWAIAYVDRSKFEDLEG